MYCLTKYNQYHRCTKMNSLAAQDCKILVFSDIHYASKKPIKSDKKLTHYALPVLEKMIAKINEIKPDAAINLGDLIEDSNNKEQDITDLKIVWNTLKKINRPFYSLNGNHDLRTMDSREEVEKIMGYESATFSVDINGYHFVFLGLDIDHDMDHAQGGIHRTHNLSKADIEWLKQDLQKNKLPCLIFNHFGFAEDNMTGNYWFEKNPSNALLANRKEIKDILKKTDTVLGVFSGHQHWTKELHEDGINYYVVGSLAEDAKGDGVPDGVSLEVDLNRNALSVKEHHLKLDL